MAKEYECCICHKLMEINKRLVYQEFDNKKPYGLFRNRYNYDFCDECFKVFISWIVRHKKENELKIGVELNFKKER